MANLKFKMISIICQMKFGVYFFVATSLMSTVYPRAWAYRSKVLMEGVLRELKPEDSSLEIAVREVCIRSARSSWLKSKLHA